MMKFGIKSMLSCLAMVACVSAQASVTQLTSAGQIATSYVNNFETVLNSGPVTLSGSLYSASAAAGGVTSSGAQGVLSSSFGFGQNITANLSSGYNAVGLYFGNDDTCCSQGFFANLSVYSGLTFLGSVSVAANMNDWADQFIGLSSTTAFDRVVLDYSGVSLYMFIDDFRLGNAVPEPASLALLGLGLAGLGAARRKNKAAA